ncbi:sulfotransferase domain-containing protein [bacterium]|nr:sulfotransferase domain-containing protein [bacterium]
MKTFILSLGVQRSGTTWIWDLLKHIPEANMGNKKEHHYWYKKDKHKWNNEDYIHYFDNLLDGEEHITGDITPIYGLCNKKQLQEAKDIIEGAGYHLKVIFVMRDPVQRLISRGRSVYEQKGITSLESWIMIESKHKHIFERQNYEKTIKNIEDVFEPENVFYGLYETFFTEKEFLRFCNFIGMEYQDTYLKRKPRLTSNKDVDLTHDLNLILKELYKETYSFCNERFPETKLLWG